MKFHSIISRIHCNCIKGKSSDKYGVVSPVSDDSMSKEEIGQDDSKELDFDYSKSLSLDSAEKLRNVSCSRISKIS